MDAAGPVGWTVWAIRQGDTSNHGGLVQSGAPKVLIVGLPAARVGDLHACPITGHGITPIVSGSAKVLIAGAPAARAGDTTACGASLIGVQGKVYIG
ncbi:hypothetical protein CSW25_05850 [Thermus scotoductus]|uniref:PAAR domain-containing protein n=1 Tax=Thermus scotoductus TaxID=37636 RepID=A0A430RFB2_THESC|nr:PAAR domain-containing protein [Thermus scotoductus]RTG97853.1 hypothetical protein CSW49_02120 [Thermus scotoductus]RTH06363.1 hypothetical protein CSW45_01860 [Thermus scotoductus]RTH11928.1 hypothetical protein CSW46_03330 [Thermus scotoductus]RTH11998.1 hypothetical protein CSW44_04820 [Thermus scotoductus]RTH12001.1 hypothetical protein CSW44_04835 [Thermus scotoductus]